MIILSLGPYKTGRSEKAVASKMSIQPNNLSPVIYANGAVGIGGVREVHGAELTSDQRETMLCPIVVVVAADYFSPGVDAAGKRKRERTGKVDGSKFASTEEENVAFPRGVAVIADDLSEVVDAFGICTTHCSGKIDGGKTAGTSKKAVSVSSVVDVRSDNLAYIVNVPQKCAGSAWKVDNAKRAMIEQVAMLQRVAVQEVAADDAEIVDGIASSLYRIRGIKRCKRAVA